MKLSQYDLKEHMFIVYTRHVKKRPKKKTQRTVLDKLKSDKIKPF
jgi:hypothetical protein